MEGSIILLLCMIQMVNCSVLARICVAMPQCCGLIRTVIVAKNLRAGLGCIQNVKIMRTLVYCFKTISYCFRTTVRAPSPYATQAQGVMRPG